MIFVRWAAEGRTLPTAEVDGVFRDLRDHVLLYAFETNRMEVANHGGHFSFKMVASGEEVYHVDRRAITVQAGRVLLMNAGERYASSIDRPRTRSISFFLPAAEVQAAFATVTKSDSSLLDAPVSECDTVPEFTQVPFRATGGLIDLTNRLARSTFSPSAPDATLLEQLVAETTIAALQANLRLVRRGALTSCVRKTTRTELVARVIRARELIEDRYGRVSLSELASAACLSRYHFLRVFRDVTGMTPAAYARRVRIERGLAELRRSGSNRRGARVAGFASVSTFLRATRRVATD